MKKMIIEYVIKIGLALSVGILGLRGIVKLLQEGTRILVINDKNSKFITIGGMEVCITAIRFDQMSKEQLINVMEEYITYTDELNSTVFDLAEKEWKSRNYRVSNSEIVFTKEL